MTIELYGRVWVKTRRAFGHVTQLKPIGGGLYMYRVLLDGNPHDERLYASGFLEPAPMPRSRAVLRLAAVNGVVLA